MIATNVSKHCCCSWMLDCSQEDSSRLVTDPTSVGPYAVPQGSGILPGRVIHIPRVKLFNKLLLHQQSHPPLVFYLAFGGNTGVFPRLLYPLITVGR